MRQVITAFINGCKAGTPESQVANAYKKAMADFESVQSGLLKSLRVEKTTKGLVPVFAAEAEGLVAILQDAEQHLKDVQKDIEDFLELTGGEPSLNGLSEALIRARRTISNVTFEANAIREKTVRQNKSMSPLEAEQLEVVQHAFDKRDRIKAELEPEIEMLQDKLSKANAILNKYASSEST